MKRSIVGLIALVLSAPVLAADEVNAGDTAWMLTATALVLFMTIPGLALFYAGMVRSKNVLSVLMQCQRGCSAYPSTKHSSTERGSITQESMPWQHSFPDCANGTGSTGR